MASVTLLTMDPESLDLLISAGDEFEAKHGITLGVNRNLARELARHTRDAVRKKHGDPGWWGYLALDHQSRVVVGSCGFKGSPDPGGGVEIAFITFPQCEGKGYATSMAENLVELAFRSGAVKRVIAHTPPEKNASTRVLEKAGFRLDGEHHDPDDGTVWRWVLEGPL